MPVVVTETRMIEAVQDQWIIGAGIGLFVIAVVVWWCKR
jgi:hypothetical protein